VPTWQISVPAIQQSNCLHKNHIRSCASSDTHLPTLLSTGRRAQGQGKKHEEQEWKGQENR
jgi:hypothetical protein